MIQTKVIDFCLPGLALSLEIVSNTEDLITDPAEDDQIPYWAELWPAAFGLAQYIWEEVDFQGQTVLEVGAGIGLPGLIAAHKGGDVTLTDYKESAMEIAARNAGRNHLKGLKFFVADWRDFQEEKQFDWIIGSDVLYNPKSNPYLGAVLEKNLQPGGQMIFSHARRSVTRSFLQQFQEKTGMKEKVVEIPVTVEHPILPNYLIAVHHLYF